MKDWTIHEIENLTESEVLLGAKGIDAIERVDNMKIKGHDIYIVDFGGYFGLSCLVFKNGRHIYYANDYQLHHRTIGKQELPQYYAKELGNILFTEDELSEEIGSYDEYRRKEYYLRNYWIMQFPRLSIFGDPKEDRSAEKAANPYMCHPCFCWVAEQSICERAAELLAQLEKAYAAFMKSDEAFREAVSHELANYEACITCDCRDALGALGLTYDELSFARKEIVNKELSRQIHEYNKSWYADDN